MQIRLNGKDRDVGEGITVAQLLEELEIRPERGSFALYGELRSGPLRGATS